MKRCLVFLDGKALEDSVDLLEAARQVHAGDAFGTTGILFDRSVASVRGTFDRVIQVHHDDVRSYDPMAVTEAMVALQRRDRYDSILIPATSFGRMLAPRLAMRLRTGLVADVTAIDRHGPELHAIRPAYSGKMFARIRFVGAGPVMMSIRPGVFAHDSRADHEIIPESWIPEDVCAGGIQLLDTRRKEQVYDIRESTVLVSGGGGVIGHFHQLERLADKLGGQVSASRKIVDQGLASRSIQVGQSGKTVSPRLYVAVGINGAVQHVEGLKRVETLIAVNTNRNAPICSMADVVVEGDAAAFLDKLVARIEGQTEQENRITE